MRKDLAQDFFSIIRPFKQRIEKALLVPVKETKEKGSLYDACLYALKTKGKRLRPLIVLLTADALDKNRDALFAALAMEYFHTASLIADDLPCMDNEDLRRDRLTLHKKFDESTALLASYTFISLGYEMIAENSSFLKEECLCAKALYYVSPLCGLKGATGGQFLDLKNDRNDFSALKEIIYKKTTTLFEASFILGWLFGGGKEDGIHTLREAAFHLGMSFQIADDFQDIEQDRQNRALNTWLLLGNKKALQLFEEHLYHFQKKLQCLNLFTQPFLFLVKALQNSIKH